MCGLEQASDHHIGEVAINNDLTPRTIEASKDLLLRCKQYFA